MFPLDVSAELTDFSFLFKCDRFSMVDSADFYVRVTAGVLEKLERKSKDLPDCEVLGR